MVVVFKYSNLGEIYKTIKIFQIINLKALSVRYNQLENHIEK